MFTGIVQTMGKLTARTRAGTGARISVGTPAAFLRRLKPGDSVAVNGCCLTVTKKAKGEFHADLAPETLRRTSLGKLRLQSELNLEAPLRAGDLLSGHVLQGHVEGTAEFLELRDGNWLRLRVPETLRPYIVWKGSLAVDGISLTVAAVEDDELGFAIIPFTAAHTNLRTLRRDDAVNLETDPLARHLERLLEARAGATGVTEKALRRQGF